MAKYGNITLADTLKNYYNGKADKFDEVLIKDLIDDLERGSIKVLTEEELQEECEDRLVDIIDDLDVEVDVEVVSIRRR